MLIYAHVNCALKNSCALNLDKIYQLRKKSIVSLVEITPEEHDLMGHVMQLLPKIAEQQGLTNGFRTIVNTGPGGGQEIGHLHFHVLGGGRLPVF